jgi:hypothetical protein
LFKLIAARRLAPAAVAVTLAAGLGACSGGIDRSDYTTPIAATAEPAPAPTVPVASPGATPTRAGRLPLLPPVPDEQSGLPPVTVAQLLPPVVH